MASPIDDGDETRACGYHRFFCVLWTPGCIKSGGCYLIELDNEDLRKFIDAKKAKRYSETSKKLLSEFSFLLHQYSAVYGHVFLPMSSAGHSGIEPMKKV